MVVAVRGLVLVLAAVCLWVGAAAHQSDARCAHVVARATGLAPYPSDATSQRLADDSIDRCRAPKQALVVAAVLRGTGNQDDALRIARALVAHAPEDYLGWLSVARLERDPQRAEAALTRAKELNPRGVPPAS